MTLRSKLVIAMVGATTVVATVLGVLVYRVTTNELRESIDRSLLDTRRGPDIRDLPDAGTPRRTNRPLDTTVAQVLAEDGSIVGTTFAGELPVNDADRAVAAGQQQVILRDVTIEGDRYRMVTRPVRGGALQLARSLQEVEQTAREVRRRVITITILVGVAAALLGWLIADQLTRRLRRLTRAAGEVSATGNLDVAVPADGTDEAGQLGQAFGEMLSTLSRSRAAQQQLVQDAGHELRTPLTSLRTNVDVLRRYAELPADQRAEVIADIDAEARELTALVNELVELATERRNDEPLERCVLGDITTRVADRARRRHGRDIVVTADTSLAEAPRAALERAIGNLIDNAVKFAPSGPIEVTVAGGTVTVRDHGPGFAAGDEARVFDRFYRSAASRTLPGSGLGLSIVQSVVERCGGAVFARNGEGGGAVVGFTLPPWPSTSTS
jgi:two-component system, OmpR family, sensor histidine kinase MprB